MHVQCKYRTILCLCVSILPNISSCTRVLRTKGKCGVVARESWKSQHVRALCRRSSIWNESHQSSWQVLDLFFSQSFVSQQANMCRLKCTCDKEITPYVAAPHLSPTFTVWQRNDGKLPRNLSFTVCSHQQVASPADVLRGSSPVPAPLTWWGRNA